MEFIMYHYVRDLKNSSYPNIKGLDIEEFKSQIKYLSKNYNIISVEDFYFKNYNPDKRNCVLTFDDGYVDHYNFVFEILVKYKIKGAFFAPVDVIKNNRVLDVNKIHLILASSTENKILERLKYHYEQLSSTDNIESLIQNIDTTSRYDSKHTILIKRLLQTVLDYPTRQSICDSLLGEFVNKTEEELSKELYLNIAQIDEMVNSGMHFGSHGKSHFWFDSLEYDQQQYEITESVEFLDSIYKDNYLLTMCYPYGNYNSNTLNLLKKHDFKLGFTTITKQYESGKDSLLTIPRFDTNDYPPKKLFAI